MPIYDPATGQPHPAQLFVAVLGASNYTYVEATLDQQLASWIGAHVRAFEFFGGCPQLVVPITRAPASRGPVAMSPI
jgi:transposase